MDTWKAAELEAKKDYRKVHVSEPHGEHTVYFDKTDSGDSPFAERIYIINDSEEHELSFTGAELASLAKWIERESKQDVEAIRAIARLIPRGAGPRVQSYDGYHASYHDILAAADELEGGNVKAARDLLMAAKGEVQAIPKVCRRVQARIDRALLGL